MLTNEAADKLRAEGIKVKATQVASLARNGTFANAKLVAGRWQIPDEDVEAYIHFRKGRKRRKWLITAGSITLCVTILTLFSIASDIFNLFERIRTPTPSMRIIHPVIELGIPIEWQLQLFPTDKVSFLGGGGEISEIFLGDHWEPFYLRREYIVWGRAGVPITPQFRGQGSVKVEIVITNYLDQPRDLRRTPAPIPTPTTPPTPTPP